MQLYQIRKLEIKNQQRFVIIAVIITAALKFILMDWLHWRAFYITGISLFWLGYIIYRVKANGGIQHMWSYDPAPFKRTILILIPFVIASIIATILYGVYNNSIIFTWRIIPVLLLYPVWGIIQQYLMLDIISNTLFTVLGTKVSRYVIILIVSVLFSFIHFPSFVLMIFTFFMEIVFVTVYLKWKNLLAIGIAHGWIATFLLYYVMGRDLWLELFKLS